MKDKTGFVYVMTKESSPEYFKIGRTEKKPQLRAVELDGTDSPTPSIVVYYVFCEDIEQLELLTHRELDSLRVRQNREWFKCSQQEAIDAIKRVAEQQEIEIHYEKTLFNVESEASENSFENSDVATKAVNEVLDSFFYYEKSLRDDLIKYKEYLNERIEILNKKSSSVGDKSLAKAAYASKVEELKEKFELNITQLLGRHKDDLGEVAVEKLSKLAKDIKDGKVEANYSTDASYQQKIEKEKNVNLVIDNLLRKIY